MARYTTRPRAGGWIDDDWDRLYGEEDEPHRPDLCVAEHLPKFTGLLDAKGEQIWREPRPVGFGRDKDW